MNRPLEKKYVRGNQSPFMNKTLSKAIMQRSKLRNISLKNRTEKNRNEVTWNRGTYVLHFLEKVKENFMIILMRKNYVIIKDFGV